MQRDKKEIAGKHAAEITGAAAAAEDRPPSLLTSAALIGIGALIEPELLAGMAIGAGVVLASRWLPDIAGDLLRPIARSAVKAGYTAAIAAREIAAEVTEQVEDLIAEVRAEQEPAEHTD